CVEIVRPKSMPMRSPLSDTSLELGSPFQHRPRFHSEPYKRHYEAHRRQSPTSSAESSLDQMRTSTSMLRHLNEKNKGSPGDAASIKPKQAFNDPTISLFWVEEIAVGIGNISISRNQTASCDPSASDSKGHRGDAEETGVPHQANSPSGLDPSQVDVCPHGVRQESADAARSASYCPHGSMRSYNSSTPSLFDVCPHGVRRAKANMSWCPHGVIRSCVRY
ncbi:hypothetical protein B0H10DRAFT_2080036, partial [Mycena sp. CBHHK59/15]